jgi:hypothetical protein
VEFQSPRSHWLEFKPLSMPSKNCGLAVKIFNRQERKGFRKGRKEEPQEQEGQALSHLAHRSHRVTRAAHGLPWHVINLKNRPNNRYFLTPTGSLMHSPVSDKWR